MPTEPNQQMSLFDLNSSPQPPNAVSSANTAKNTASSDAPISQGLKPQPLTTSTLATSTLAASSLGYASLDELEQSLQGCQKCPLSQSRTQIVFERGNRHGKIVVIGEAPGQNEDELGLPFVGRSGQLLDKIFASVGLDTNRDVYICNVNKCRPENNRPPTDAEIAACKPFLLEQLRLLNPHIILLTGATAVKAILKTNLGITKIRGQWSQWEGRWVMPIFHPAYLLRNSSREVGKPKWLMWQDIQAVKAKLMELSGESPSAEAPDQDNEVF